MIYDTLIVGSGIAGLSLAIKLAQLKPKSSIAVISKTNNSESNTAYAQGGVAAVIDKSDSFENHIEDTLKAGHFLNNKAVVELVVKSAPERLAELIEWGAKFDFMPSGNLDLGMEGGHSAHRIVHHKDSSGKEIFRSLMHKASSFKNIEIIEHLFIYDLLKTKDKTEKCIGVKALNNRTKDQLIIKSQNTILASGGIGQVFSHTTNPRPSTGDGIAMAHRAGVSIIDMNYVQFHPTALYGNDNPSFLISEAVRGFGALLINHKGERFMANYDPRLELATRDVVSSAVASEMEKENKEYVFLDCRHLNQKEFKNSFPTIYSKCSSAGIDLQKDMIPVTPAAHYLCGGIDVNIKGKTSLTNLYACGECARTGLHGSNRLASNSLLEALVFAHVIAKEIGKPFTQSTTNGKETNEVLDSTNLPKPTFNINELKSIMSKYVGVRKTKESLQKAKLKLEEIEINVLNNEDTSCSVESLEAINLLVVAKLIVEESLENKDLG